MKSHADDLAGMTTQGQAALVLVLSYRCCVPQPYVSIVAAGIEPLAVRTEHDTPNGLKGPTQRENFLTACHIPELHVLVRISRGQAPAVRTERQAPDTMGAPAQITNLLSRHSIPKLQFPAAPLVEISSTGGEESAIWAEGHTAHIALVAGNRALPLPGSHVPKTDPPIRAPRSEALTVGAKCQAVHLCFMTGKGIGTAQDMEQGMRRLASCCIPDLDLALLIARRQVLTVRAKGDAMYTVAVPLQGAQISTGLRIPNLNGPIPTCRCEPLTIGTERHAADIVFMSGNAEEFLVGLGIPNGHGPILTTGGNLSAIGTEREAEQSSAVVQGGPTLVAQSSEIAPFPIAQVDGASFE